MCVSSDQDSEEYWFFEVAMYLSHLVRDCLLIFLSFQWRIRSMVETPMHCWIWGMSKCSLWLCSCHISWIVACVYRYYRYMSAESRLSCFRLSCQRQYCWKPGLWNKLNPFWTLSPILFSIQWPESYQIHLVWKSQHWIFWQVTCSASQLLNWKGEESKVDGGQILLK